MSLYHRLTLIAFLPLHRSLGLVISTAIRSLLFAPILPTVVLPIILKVVLDLILEFALAVAAGFAMIVAKGEDVPQTGTDKRRDQKFLKRRHDRDRGVPWKVLNRGCEPKSVAQLCLCPPDEEISKGLWRKVGPSRELKRDS